MKYKFDNRVGEYDFFCRSGEISVILGKNGIGKSTLFEHILDISTKNLSGEITINNEDILKINTKNRSKIISYLPQKTVNSQSITVFEYVLTGRTPYIGLLEIPDNTHKEIAIKYLKLFGVEHLQDRNIATLSGGEFGRVAVAKVFTQETKVVLLDEPTASLDYESSFQFMELLLEYGKSENKIIIATLHDPNLALKYAHKFIILGDNKVDFEVGKEDYNLVEILENLYNMQLVTVENEKILLKK